MYISRVVVRNFRNFEHLDLNLEPGITTIIGENNTGKTNLLQAIRLAVDANLSSYHRTMTQDDFHRQVSILKPQQIVVSLEFSGFTGTESDNALVCHWMTGDDCARLTYRFLPRQHVIQAHNNDEEIQDLSLNDYHWTLSGGGDPEIDPATVEWHEKIGTAASFSELQQFAVEYLPALRDVTRDLRNSRRSPLNKLLTTTPVPQDEQDQVVGIIGNANDQVLEKSTTLSAMGDGIHDSYAETVGEAHQIDVQLGMLPASFESIFRNLTLLLGNEALDSFSSDRNGLGLNNILYTSMLVQYFENRIEDESKCGQLLMVEEPEAHLHPQLQRVLYSVLSQKHFQALLTSHSSHISSHAPLDSIVLLTNTGGAATAASNLTQAADLDPDEIADLERFLDATRSTLLFARKLLLVEGPAELFLLPPLIKEVLEIDLDREGISVVSIHGKHFQSYAKLFNSEAMPKKVAIIADRDLDEPTDNPPEDPLEEINTENVRVFLGDTTFEREITLPGTLNMHAQAASAIGSPGNAAKIQEAYNQSLAGSLTDKKLNETGKVVLSTAKNKGKARYSQIAARYADSATEVPSYIIDALSWLRES